VRLHLAVAGERLLERGVLRVLGPEAAEGVTEFSRVDRHLEDLRQVALALPAEPVLVDLAGWDAPAFEVARELEEGIRQAHVGVHQDIDVPRLLVEEPAFLCGKDRVRRPQVVFGRIETVLGDGPHGVTQDPDLAAGFAGGQPHWLKAAVLIQTPDGSPRLRTLRVAGRVGGGPRHGEPRPQDLGGAVLGFRLTLPRGSAIRGSRPGSLGAGRGESDSHREHQKE
jgi:hypothetical protein